MRTRTHGYGSIYCIASCRRFGNRARDGSGCDSAITSLACVFHFVYIFYIER